MREVFRKLYSRVLEIRPCRRGKRIKFIGNIIGKGGYALGVKGAYYRRNGYNHRADNYSHNKKNIEKNPSFQYNIKKKKKKIPKQGVMRGKEMDIILKLKEELNEKNFEWNFKYQSENIEDIEYFLESILYYKENVIDVLEKELSSGKINGIINIGSVCDSYQPCEKELGLMREILKVMIIH